MLSVEMISVQPIPAQLDNSTNIGEEETQSPDIFTVIYGIVLVITIIASAIRAYNPKAKVRAGIAFFLLFISFVMWLSTDNLTIFAILLVFIALILVLYRVKRPVPWKKYKGIRRHFSAEVREQIIKDQKNKRANCDMSISQPLVHFDHIDGNHSNNDISNCQCVLTVIL
jgi:hypothetical protein